MLALALEHHMVRICEMSHGSIPFMSKKLQSHLIIQAPQLLIATDFVAAMFSAMYIAQCNHCVRFSSPIHPSIHPSFVPACPT